MKTRRLSHFAWISVEGSDPQSREGKKSQKVLDSHRNDVSPLTQGLRYRAACGAKIQALAADSGVGWLVTRLLSQATSRQILAPPASRTLSKVHACYLRFWRPTGVWTIADGGCAHVRRMVHGRVLQHTRLKRTSYSRPTAVHLTRLNCIGIWPWDIPARHKFGLWLPLTLSPTETSVKWYYITQFFHFL